MIYCDIQPFDLQQKIYSNNILVASSTLPDLAEAIVKIPNEDNIVYLSGFEELVQGIAAQIKMKNNDIIVRMVQNV